MKYFKPLVYIFALMLLFQFFAAVYLLIIAGFTGNLEDVTALSGNAQSFGLLLTQISMLIFLLLVFKKYGIKHYWRIKKAPRKAYLWAFIAGFAMINISLLVMDVMNLIIPEALDRYIEVVEASFGDTNLLLGFIVVVIGASLIEEIMLRGIYFRFFENILPVWLLIGLSGLFFGLFHMNIVQGIFGTLIGILMALAFYWIRSLWIPILMHMGNNLHAWLGGAVPEAWLEATPMVVFNYILMFVVLPISLYQLYRFKTTPSDGL